MELKVVTNNSQVALEELDVAKVRALEIIGLKAESYAKRQCPVDTGRLRNSISHATDEDTAYIGTNVEYAPYVELGTSRMKERPFLKPAALDHVDEYKAIVLNELKK